MIGGSGTAVDPYVISGWDIDASASNGISISGTTAFFAIRGVYIHASGGLSAGIQIRSPNGIVEDSVLTGNGIAVIGGGNLTLRRNTVLLNVSGFFVTGTNVTIQGNNVAAQDPSSSWSPAVDAFWAKNVTVTGNNLTHAFVYYRCTDGGVVADNLNVNGSGIFMASSRHVVIFHNTLLNSTAADDMYYDDHGTGCNWNPGNNTWDDGYPSGGNYWSLYAGVDLCTGPQQDVCPAADGIGDTPMKIPTFNPSAPGNFTDRYPLMMPLRGPVDTRFYTLYGFSTFGWGFTYTNLTTPGPVLFDYVGFPVNLTLQGLDGAAHEWFLDLNNNSVVDSGEPATPTFTSDVLNFTFTPARAGTFAYRDALHPAQMWGMMIIGLPPPPGPAASFSVTPTVGNATTIFTFDASASTSGSSSPSPLQYRWNWNGDGTWDTSWSSSPTASHVFGADGTYSVTLQVMNANMVTAEVTHPVVVDSVAPVTAVDLSGTQGNASWYRSAVTVTLVATDATTDVASTLYRLDGGVWTAYSSPLAISVDGVHTVSVSSTDRVGNVESPHDTTFSVDMTPPVLHITSASGVVPSPFTVAWTGSDAASGIADYRVSLDNETFTDVGLARSLALNLTAGDHSVRVVAVDVAGNSAVATVFLRIMGPTSVPVSNLPPLEVLAAIGAVTAVAAIGVVYAALRIRGTRRPPGNP